MRHGTTLVEILVVLIIAGLLLVIGVPHLAAPLDRVAVEQAGYDLLAAHGRARLAAVLQGRVSLLEVRPDSLTIRVVTDPDTNLVWSAPGPALTNVTLSGPAYPLFFAPSGLAMGFSNARFILVRGNARREVVVSRLGRARMQ